MPSSKPLSSQLSSQTVSNSQADRTQTYAPSHSSWFDEVAIALPSYIDSPILATVATKLQSQLFASLSSSDDSHSTIYTTNSYPANSHSANSHTKSCDSNNTVTVDSQLAKTTSNKSDIRQANTILTHLLHTPIADASVLVALTNEPKPKLLLTRRASHLNAHAGEVSFAGGKYEYDDGNNVVTALREACEETALPPSRVQIVGQLPTETSKAGMSVRPIVALIDPDVTYVPELGEIERIFWADFETLIHQPMVDYEFAYQLGDNKGKFVTPSWIIDGETVWGLTGRVIASLLKVCFEREIEWYYRPKISP